MNAHVEFVGAGPGAADLITVRGLNALKEADLVVYAGSLVNPVHLEACKEGCVCLDSSSMNLGEQVEAMSSAALAGKKVVRLHTGDPAMYGAVDEQIKGLAARGVSVSIVPGVSSVFAAAAALGCELTAPEISQSVVLTRSAGRTPMPAGETPAAFARTGATLVFFLSTGKAAAIMDELMTKGGLPADTPAAIVYRATWPDERVLRGTVGDIARQAEVAGLGRQALILVGRALGEHREESRLYDEKFSHGYRNNLPREFFHGRCALYAFTDKALVRAREIAAGLGNPAVIHSTRARHEDGVVYMAGKDFNRRLAAQWNSFDAHIFISAAGIAVRKIAPLLQDKTLDPAVLACAESGSHVVSLTAGHLGGANRLARRVARITGGQAVVSTATDVNGLPAFDEIAALEQARVLNTEAIRPLNAALLAGECVTFCGSKTVYDKYFAGSEQVIFTEDAAGAETDCALRWDCSDALPEGIKHLDVTSRAFVLGVGCRRGVDPAALRDKAEHWLREFHLVPAQIAALASADLKKEEPAIRELAEAWGLNCSFYSAEELDAVSVPTPSATVKEKIGTASVCEAASLLAAGYNNEVKPRLYAPKAAFGDVTFALARLPHRHDAPRAVGEMVVVGLGSGAAGQITPEADYALRSCDTVAGYRPYVDFVRDRITGKPVIENGMKGEVARCTAALEAALEGKKVCMVCSGDPGILAMAGLLYELRVQDARFASIPIRVLPGITSASIAAASLGAPLQNGFSLVSLSDLLVPADEVRANLRAVAQSQLPVTLYNPAGRRRRELLSEALAIFREVRGADVLCACVKNAGRPQEEKWTGRLRDFPVDEVDMSTLVIVGGPRTRLLDGVMYEARGYVEKYLK